MSEVENRINESINRIKVLKSGEKIKCPECNDGYIEAVGNPTTTSCFSCRCGCKIILDKKVNL